MRMNTKPCAMSGEYKIAKTDELLTVLEVP